MSRFSIKGGQLGPHVCDVTFFAPKEFRLVKMERVAEMQKRCCKDTKVLLQKY